MAGTESEPGDNRQVPERPLKRNRTPTVLQMEAAECGAASLAMVLAHYGRWVPLGELRIECGVSRDGAKASNLLKAARRYGLKGKGFKKEAESLRNLRTPAILFWNFNHFVVLEGFGKKGAYLNDPASGPRIVSEEEIEEAFTGVVLVFEPGPDFRKEGERPSAWAGLRQRLRGSETALAYLVLVSLALVIPGLLIPTFARVFVDQVLLGHLESWLIPLILGMGLTVLLRGGLTWLQGSCLLRFETKLSVSGSSRFLEHVLRLPVQFFAQRYAGDISTRVGLNDRVAQLLSRDLATNVLNALMVVFFAVLMFWYDAALTLVAVGIACLNLVALRYVSRKRVVGNQRLLQERGKLMGTTMAGLMGIESLKASGGESDFFAKWSGHHAKVVNAQQDFAQSTLFLSTVPPLLAALNTPIILGLGGLRVMEGALTIGMLVAFQSLMASFVEPFNKLVELGGSLQDAQGDILRLDDALKYEADEPADQEGAAAAPNGAKVKLTGEVELRNVTFGYSPMEKPLIKDFSLELKPGDRVALVGGSGSGKSTVAKLVCGLYEPWEGEILFDRVPRRETPHRVLHSSFAFVDQDISLLEDTVKNNLTLWDSTLPEGDIVNAAGDACIHEDVSARPGGYLSQVREGGTNFSGGQRQRIEIARALVVNPSILVLDEATSALDPVTEQSIDDNLRRRGCTCIIVAHRLSTIRDCDEIIVLERGKVIGRGTHEELIEGCEAYTRLVQGE